jgi:hypothetical protein
VRDQVFLVPVAVFNYEDSTTDEFGLISSDHKRNRASTSATVIRKISSNPISEKDFCQIYIFSMSISTSQLFSINQKWKIR